MNTKAMLIGWKERLILAAVVWIVRNVIIPAGYATRDPVIEKARDMLKTAASRRAYGDTCRQVRKLLKAQ